MAAKEKMNAIQRALQTFRRKGGVIKTAQALHEGIHPGVLYRMRDEGLIENLGRGLYKLKDQPLHGDPDLLQVGARFPNAVVCLVSALSYHELTTQIPRSIHLAIKKGSHQPKVLSPPCSFFSVADKQFKAGIQTLDYQGVKMRIYDPEKTVVDCFKFRSRIGLDVAIEALKVWKEKRGKNVARLLEYARLCRVEKVLMPYLEALS
jgi:predicted transcriptional regulator of viral defense system